MDTIPEDVVQFILSLVLSRPWALPVVVVPAQNASASASTSTSTTTDAAAVPRSDAVDYTDKAARAAEQRGRGGGGGTPAMSAMLVDEVSRYEAMMRFALVCRKWHRMVYALKGGPPGWLGACGRVTLGRDPAVVQEFSASSMSVIAHKAAAVISSLLPGNNTKTYSEIPKISVLGGATGWKCRLKKYLRVTGHHGKVYACAWGGDCSTFASASQDGKVLIHRLENQAVTLETNIHLASCWVMCCALSPSCQFAASGGLDNAVTIHQRVGQAGKIVQSFGQHTGYISCIKFLNENRILSSSGDFTCMLHDMETNTLVATFQDAPGDAMSISINPANTNIFATGLCNATAVLYDIRCPTKAIAVFAGADSDINSVTISSNGTLLGTASDDGGCRVYDIRQNVLANIFLPDRPSGGVTSVDFSLSGHFIFSGHDDFTVSGWSVLTGQPVWRSSIAQNRVSCISMCPDGSSLLSCAWDTSLYLYMAP
ncbi:G protein complex beta subunit SfaD [Pelomyxa schiedti]|nr:G protein complex beta subunit SfaD [Pelomyxa schiedti]